MLLGAMADQAEQKWLERKVEAGKLPGLVKVTSGRQPGIPRHWRRVMAHVLPWRVDCRGSYLRWWSATIEVTAEHGWRNPSPAEYLRLMVGPKYGTFMVIDLETATATLKWAVPATRVEWAVGKVRGTGGDAGYDGVHVPRR